MLIKLISMEINMVGVDTNSTGGDGFGKKQFVIIDRETKRETEAYGLVVPKWSPHPYRYDGVQVSQVALRDLAENVDLPKRALRIAVWLISRVERNGVMRIRQSVISDSLHMHKSDVSRGLRELFVHGDEKKSHGVARRPILSPRTKPAAGVRPSVAWRGTSKDLAAAMAAEQLADKKIAEDRARPKPELVVDAEYTDDADEVDDVDEDQCDPYAFLFFHSYKEAEAVTTCDAGG